MRAFLASGFGLDYPYHALRRMAFAAAAGPGGSIPTRRALSLRSALRPAEPAGPVTRRFFREFIDGFWSGIRFGHPVRPGAADFLLDPRLGRVAGKLPRIRQIFALCRRLAISGLGSRRPVRGDRLARRVRAISRGQARPMESDLSR